MIRSYDELYKKYKNNIETERTSFSNEIYIKLKFEYTFQIIIPFNVHEYFITLYKNKEEIWTNWDEWYISGNITKDNINNYYFNSLDKIFSKIVNASEVKVLNNNVLIKIDSQWEKLDF